MEQKQIDEIDESYFGEEFIDDEEEEVKIEEVKPKKEKKAAKKTKAAKKAKKKEPKKEAAVKIEEPELEEKVEDPVIEEEKPEEEGEVKPEEDPFKEEPKVEAKSEPLDPWADDSDNDSGIFKEASTWKMITGILVILLVVSVFTQGFNFTEGVTGNVVTEGTLSLSEAEQKALDFVNSNLLQPPFEAELESSEDVGSLYLVTLSVAGQSVDSYLTKDGKLFFPQGFDTVETDFPDNSEEDFEEFEDLEEVEAVEEELTEEEQIEEIVEEIEEELGLGEEPEEEVEEVTEEEVAEEEEEPVTTGPTKQFTITAKKWLFSPHELKVNDGDKIVLTIVAQDLDFTFAVPEFGVEEEVSGTTKVEFVVDKVGEFEFKCSSCEDWRGMTGTLVVE